jgi:hypothetical protein
MTETSESRYEGGKEGRIKALDRRENKRTSNMRSRKEKEAPLQEGTRNSGGFDF